MRQTVLITLESRDPVTVRFDGRDIRAWETKHHKSALREPMSVSMLSWLGWHAAKRQGVMAPELHDWSAFDAACQWVEGVKEEPTDPTQTAPGDGSS